MSNFLELRGLSIGYDNKKEVLSGIDLKVSSGEILVLAGPNGSGKTTLLKTMGGLLQPLEGKVYINGRDIGSLKPGDRAALSAFLFQVRESPWPFTVRETVSQGSFARRGWLGREKESDREAVNMAIEKAGLGDYSERRITELSGGELQRVFIARCIAQGALFLLLDEPGNNLDPKYAFIILTLLSDLVKEGRGAIISLHDLRLASRFANRVALLSPVSKEKSGSICALGTPEEVLTEENLSKVFDLKKELVRELVL
ncbi:MAG: ABC transporter ATP-binding protein [Treponema sp.]|nr:ABC transporter ATP-binding protein [Treponema sp.]